MGRALLHVFVESVDRSEVRSLPFRCCQWRQGAALSVDWLPAFLPVAENAARGILNKPSVLVFIEAFTIDAHGRGRYHATHRTIDQRLE